MKKLIALLAVVVCSLACGMGPKEPESFELSGWDPTQFYLEASRPDSPLKVGQEIEIEPKSDWMRADSITIGRYEYAGIDVEFLYDVCPRGLQDYLAANLHYRSTGENVVIYDPTIFTRGNTYHVALFSRPPGKSCQVSVRKNL